MERWDSRFPGPAASPSLFSLGSYKNLVPLFLQPVQLKLRSSLSLLHCRACTQRFRTPQWSDPNFSKASSGMQLMSVVVHVGWADTISDSRGAIEVRGGGDCYPETIGCKRMDGEK